MTKIILYLIILLTYSFTTAFSQNINKKVKKNNEFITSQNKKNGTGPLLKIVIADDSKVNLYDLSNKLIDSFYRSDTTKNDSTHSTFYNFKEKNLPKTNSIEQLKKNKIYPDLKKSVKSGKVKEKEKSLDILNAPITKYKLKNQKILNDREKNLPKTNSIEQLKKNKRNTDIKKSLNKKKEKSNILTNEVNNTLITADLYVYTGSGSVNTYNYNTSTHILSTTVSVANATGATTASSFYVGYYLSTNTTISTGDYLWASTYKSSLSGGFFSKITSSTVDLDTTNIPAGTYYVGAYIDYKKTVAESNESNNAVYYTPTITKPYSIFNAWWSDSTDTDGDGYTRYRKIVFDADASSGTHSVYAKIYVKTYTSSSYSLYFTTSNFNITGNSASDDYWVAVGTPNTELSRNIYDFKIQLYEAGSSTVMAIRDQSDDSDLDNEKFETFSEDSVGTLPDLFVYTGSGSVNTYNYNTSTHTLSTTVSVGNPTGASTASSFYVGYYLSTNTIISTGDHLWDSTYQNSLSGGFFRKITSSSIDLDTTNIPGGDYYVGAYIDYKKTVSESNESNNTVYYTPTILLNQATATTDAAASVTKTTATLNGTVNPNGLSTTVEFEYGTTTSYGNTVTATQSPVSGSSNVSVSANITGLTANTSYHYRVKATNSAGTVYGEDSTFTTLANQAAITTNTATSVTKTTATLNGAVNPNGTSTTVQFEYGTTTSYGSTTPASQSPVSGNSNVSVSSNITGLASNTQYHFRVKATNSAGIVYGSDSTFTTLANQATATTNTATSVTKTTATLNGNVNPNGSSTAVVLEYGTTTSYGNTTSATPSPISGNSDVSVSANITGLTANTLYHFRVKATNNAGTVYGEDTIFTTNFNYASSITLTKSYTFGNPEQPSSYKLISLPGNFSNSLSQFLTGTAKQDWDAYYDNGSTSDYLVQFNNTSTFQFKPGNGFWIISKNTINISQNVSTVLLNTDNTYSISLHSGWNIISNPFDRSVVWANIISINSINTNPIIYEWNSSWSTPSTFVPYKGYYFNNMQNLTSLKIPYNPNGTLSKNLSKSTEFDVLVGTNSLRLILDFGKEEKPYIIISIDSTSNNDFDANDILAPPGDFEEVGINLHNEKLTIPYKSLLKESRPIMGDGQVFNIYIKNKQTKKLIMKIEGVRNFERSEVYLLDIYNHKLFNIKESNSFNLSPKQKSSYQILIGNSNFIKAKEKEILPKEFILHQNYPNPFNPTTIIRYGLPSESRVSIIIYNVLGQVIKELVNNTEGAGYHEVTFNANRLASGIYFYRIISTSIVGNLSFTETKKLTLLK